jgi:hypothetical protein
MNSIFLYQTRRDLGEHLTAEERQQVNPKPVPMTLYIFRVPLTGREVLIFLPKLGGSKFESPTIF